jgi:hypothetical protein
MISIAPPSAVVGATVGCGRAVVAGRVVGEGIGARRVGRAADAGGVAVASANSVVLTTLGPRADSVGGAAVCFEGSTDSTGATVDATAAGAGADGEAGAGAEAAAVRCAGIVAGPMMRSANTYPPANPATTPITTATVVIGRALTG